MKNLFFNIADIQFHMKVPKKILGKEYESFYTNTGIDPIINILVKPQFFIRDPRGKLIHDRELEWYINLNNDYCHCLVMRDEKTSRLAAKMKANREWTDIIISYNPKYPNIDFVIHILLVEIVFRNRILFHNGLVVHASAVCYKDYCVVFTAPSGTGKTTHAQLWEKYLGAVVINDDHPAIKLINNKPVVYGTPWAGSTYKYKNTHAPLKAIVILEKAPFNSIRKLNSDEIINHLLPRCFLPYYDKELMKKAMDLFESMISKVPVYLLKCRPDQEAVNVAVKEIENLNGGIL